MPNIWTIDNTTGLRWRDYEIKVKQVFPKASVHSEYRNTNYYYNRQGYSYPKRLYFYSIKDYSLASFPIIGEKRADRERAWKSAYLYIKKCDPEAFNVQSTI